jgi:hypothetical protein
MSTIYFIGYSTLNFSKLFIIQAGKVSCLKVFFDYLGGKGCASLFIYLVVQNDPEFLDFGLINSLPFSNKPSTCKNVFCLRKGFKVWSYFLESSVM